MQTGPSSGRESPRPSAPPFCRSRRDRRSARRFALQENSGSGLGNAFAGGAAAAEDASTIWSNPAGMSRLASPQVAAAVHLVTPSFKFRDEGSLAAAFQPLGGTGGDAGSLAVIPNLYAAVPINEAVGVGIGVNAPFGLVTEYDDNWLGRFQGDQVGHQDDQRQSVAVVARQQHVCRRRRRQLAARRCRADEQGQLQRGARAGCRRRRPRGGLIPPSLVPTIIGATPGLESNAQGQRRRQRVGMEHRRAVGCDAADARRRAYRSSIKYNVAGNVNFDNPALPTLPPALAPVVGLLAPASTPCSRTAASRRTSSCRTSPTCRCFTRLERPLGPDGGRAVHALVDVQGAQVRAHDRRRCCRTRRRTSTMRGGSRSARRTTGTTRGASAAVSRGTRRRSTRPDRTPRLPDEDRVWIAVGAQYKFSRNLALDAGFAYIPMQEPRHQPERRHRRRPTASSRATTTRTSRSSRRR